MTNNFTPAKAGQQSKRLSKEEYAEKMKAEKEAVYQMAVIRQIKCGFIYQIIYACFKNSNYRIAALFTAILSGYLMPKAITQIA